MNKIKDFLINFLKGIAMGVVETVPGVSGSTVALVGGIYERFINSLKSFNISSLTMLFKLEFNKFWKYIDGSFLLSVLVGMISGIVISVFTVTKFLKTNPQEVWSFFFGLVLASGIILIYNYFIKDFIKNKNIENAEEKKVLVKDKKESYLSNYDLFSDKAFEKDHKKNNNEYYKEILKNIIFFIIGLSGTIALVFSDPFAGNESLFFIFFAGVFAITAFLLPGISGSFILLLLGVYSLILNTFKEIILNFNTELLLIISIFSLGIFFGIIVFSRLISFIFEKWKKTVIIFLSGVIFGSLLKLWPWKIPKKILLDDGKIVDLTNNYTFDLAHQKYKIISEANFLPTFSNEIFIIILFFILGFLLMVTFNTIAGEKIGEENK